MEPPWIIAVVISAIIGYTVPHGFRLVGNIFRRSDRRHLEGDWCGYHVSFRNGEPEIFATKWRFRTGRLREFVIERDHADGSLRFRGTIRRDIGHNAIVFEGLTHKEQLFYHLTDPIPSNSKYMIGFWLSYDHDRRIASGAVVVSQEPLDEPEIMEILKKRIKKNAKYPLMRVSP